MKITFFTNLDEAKPYVYLLNCYPPGWQGEVPSVGHDVEVKMSPTRAFTLRVVAVTWLGCGKEASVELHMSQQGNEHPRLDRLARATADAALARAADAQERP